MCTNTFRPVANKVLTYAIIITSMINIVVRAILLHAELYKMYEVHRRLSYILNEIENHYLNA